MNYKELAKDILQLHTPDPQVILKIAREQQETLKKFDESFKEGVEVLAQAKDLIRRGHDGWQKAEAEVERLKANLRRAIEIADVLRSGGSRACRELHHSKKDQHEYGDVCPVEERLEKASEELDGLQATLNQTDK
jgi:hypothetical protein